MKVCVIGAGAIGGYFGVRLAQAGAELSVVARGRTLEALQSRGWALESGGTRTIFPVRAVASAAELGAQDVVILAVKAYSVAAVAGMVPQLLGPSTMVVPAVNGMPWWFTRGRDDLPITARLASADPDGTIERAIPIDAVIGSVVYPSCATPEPGVSLHSSGSKLVFGDVRTPAGSAPTPRVQKLVALLREAGFDAEINADIRSEVWKKLLGNACFNPVSMLTGSFTDDMIDDARIYALFVAMMQESLAVGHALGIDAGIEPPARLALTRKLGHVQSSMLQDAAAGRPLEIDAILGAVIEIADALRVPVPNCKAVYALARLRAQTFGLLASRSTSQ